jgi:RecB family exonuclease
MSSADQLTLGGMPTRLFSCTPSRLAAFDCPRRYRFTYLDRPTPPKGPAWAHNTVGAVAHLALATWWNEPLAQRTPQRGAELVERSWGRAGFRDEAQSTRHRRITAGWVRQYLEDVDPAHEPLGVERTVGAPVGHLALSGRIDRIDERPAEIVIVDYKTGRRGIGADDARTSQALALYVLAARRSLRRDCHRVELHHLPTGDVVAFEHTEETLARHVARAEATADDIQAATDTMESGADPDDVFPVATGPGCSWCDFRPSCPEGRAASSQLDPWAALAEAGE